MALAWLPQCFACLVIRQYRHNALVDLAIGGSLDVSNVTYFFFLKVLTL